MGAYSINKMIVNVEQSSFSGVVLNVCRLVGLRRLLEVRLDLTTRSMILATRERLNLCFKIIIIYTFQFRHNVMTLSFTCTKL